MIHNKSDKKEVINELWSIAEKIKDLIENESEVRFMETVLGNIDPYSETCTLIVAKDEDTVFNCWDWIMLQDIQKELQDEYSATIVSVGSLKIEIGLVD
jgi:hypothetical protein